MALKTTQESNAEVWKPQDYLPDLRAYIKELRVERDNARAEFEQAKARFEKADKDLSDLERAELVLAEKAGESPALTRDPIADPKPNRSQPAISPSRGRRVPYAELAVGVLERAGRRLTTNEIVQELGRKGYIPLEEADQYRGAVYSSMARYKHAIRRVDGCWDLVGCRDVPKSATPDQPPRSVPSFSRGR
jgi:hypothetical protein